LILVKSVTLRKIIKQQHMNEALFYNAAAIATRSGYASMKRYYRQSESWEEAYYAMGENGIPVPDPYKEFDILSHLGVRLVLAGEKEFPNALRHISQPPFGVYIRGGAIPPTHASAQSSSMLAIVGTRHASAEGKKTARHFARDLAAAGCAIVSGLAFGVDGAAHEGALDARGMTIAVLAGGLDVIYPQSHDALARRILETGGTIISEYPPGAEPLAYRFIERNRIISGISRGVLIVEAPESSGALATARFAVEQNREVFVVPGAISTNNFKGSHALIRQGAELVTSPDDILNEYEIDKKENIAARGATVSQEQTLILKALADIHAPANVDKIIALTRLEPRIVNQTLSFMIIEGIIKESGEGYTI
jgi:DNA processing protein